MINKTIVQGRLCADPELRHTQSDIAVASFRVAWSEKYKDNETRLFLNCTAWRGAAEAISKYFTKGKEIIVVGKLSTREYEDKEGVKRTVTELTVEEFSFCGKKEDGANGSTVETPPPSTTYAASSASGSKYDDVNLNEDFPF